MDDPSSDVTPSWSPDRVFWGLVAVGMLLRGLAWWGIDDPTLCTRDECIFRTAARQILQGRGLLPAPTGWLPAPGYPALLAAVGALTGRVTDVRAVQWLMTPVLLAATASLAHRAGGRRVGWLATGLVAVHPTLVFFAITTWTETVYTTLLVATAATTLWAREGHPRRALVPGLLLGASVLTRGVATWLAPVVLAGLLWPRPERPTRAVRRGLATFLALALVVSPWSLYASQRYGGLVISDLTAGYVAWLGNSRFPPITYDYAIGPVDREVYEQRVGARLPPCPRDQGPVAQDRCLFRVAADHITDRPDRFVARIPQRMAQLFNPHTFLTRHLRWHYAPGLPRPATELLVVLTALTSVLITWGGTVGAWARARGPLAIATVGVVLYHVGVIAGLYGVSRFRLPFEPLLAVWLAVALADPRASLGALRADPRRALGLALTLSALVPATLWFAWTAWPGWLW